MAQIDIKNTVMKIKGGDGEQLEINIGEGTITYSERRNIEYTLNRGILDEVKEGDQAPVEVRFDLVWEYIKGPGFSSTTGAGTPTPSDALKQVGGAGNWVSSDTDLCRPYAVDIEIEYTPNCVADDETITLADFRYEQIDHDLSAGTLAVTGKCNITQPTSVRSA